MNDCFDCSLPSSVKLLEAEQNQGTFGWSAFNSSLAVNLQYRKVGEMVLNTVINIKPPFTLTGLEPCTDYEYQIESICGDTTSSYTDLIQFTTEGCCENPEEVHLVILSDTEVFLEWEPIVSVSGYQLRYKLITDELWVDLEDTENSSLTIDGLVSCSDYEFQTKAICGNGSDVEWSRSFNFSTIDCGLCIEGDYCEVSGLSTSSEWIDQINIHETEINSGNNNGYFAHEDLDIVLSIGGDFSFQINPGFANQALPEDVHVWIDLNQNEVFEEEELLLESPIIRETWEARLLIPMDASLGSTRMRVMQSWVENEYDQQALNPCDKIEFGEVEDICVYISASKEPCVIPINDLNLISTDESSAILNWDADDNASEFIVSYRELGAPDFESFYSDQSTIIINGLEVCLRYEVQVSALCNGIATEPSESLFIDIECVPLSTNEGVDNSLITVLRNPFRENINIQLKEPFGDLDIELYHSSGAVIHLTRFTRETDSITLDGLKNLIPGIYILRIVGEEGDFVFKMIKV